MGDINAHSELWFSRTDDHRAANRGNQLSDQVVDSEFCVLNEDTPTRIPTSGNPSSPDITLATSHLALQAGWSTHRTLCSDHLPITVSLEVLSPADPIQKQSYQNFNKADWDAFKEESERKLTGIPLPISCCSGERKLRDVLLEAGSCLLYTSPSPRDKRQSRMPSSA